MAYSFPGSSQVNSIAEAGLASVDDKTAVYELGTVVTDSYGNRFAYFQVVDGPTTAGDGTGCSKGACMLAGAATWGIVSCDYSGGSALGTKVLGIALGDVTTDYHGWFQISGFCDYVRSDGSVAAGEYMVADTAGGTDEEADTMADGEEEQVFGMSLVADGAHASTAVILNCW